MIGTPQHAAHANHIAVPAEVFAVKPPADNDAEDDNSGPFADFKFDAATVGQDICIEVRNKSDKALVFAATMLGRTTP